MSHMRGALVIVACLAPVMAQDWDTIHAQAVAAVRNGNWRQAEPLLQSALREAENTSGAPLFTSLKDLADFYQMQGRV